MDTKMHKCVCERIEISRNIQFPSVQENNIVVIKVDVK